jgi:site-specific DNA-methyltransferase (adenine-specific)
MTRTQACRDQISWIETNCPLDRTSIIPIKKAAEFCDKNVEISTLSTDAIQPLIKIQDSDVKNKVVASLKSMIDTGKKPTKREVMTCIQKITKDNAPEPIPLPEGKYSVIYADPPWQYDHGSISHGGVDKHYSTMDLESIKALPIGNLAADDCVLLLWATFPQLREALEVIEAWGFSYLTLGFSWIKTNTDGSPFFGVGYYAKSNCEVCLLATKGNAHGLVASNSVSSVVLAPRGCHSQKPDEVRNKIVELFGDVPRIELFSRERILGWDCWGNQIPGSDLV